MQPFPNCHFLYQLNAVRPILHRAADRLQLLENTGRSLAKASGLQPGPNLVASIQKSVESVNKLGATAELTKKGNDHYVICHSCTVATLVHNDPLTCRLVAAFFAEASGREVSVLCKRDGTIVCGFRFN